MITPLIDRLRTKGGTLYTFSSASKDLSRTFSNDIYDFSFSHFACLNLPNIKNGKYTEGKENGLYLYTLLDSAKFENEHNKYGITSYSGEGMNIALAENFQNYIFNFETAILNGSGDNDDYDNSVILSSAERLFFNWLQKVGAIKFEKKDKGFIEKDTSVVKYIGTIDAINSVDICGDSYSEVYLYIPGEAGSTNNGDIYFKTPSDKEDDGKNYIPDKEYDIYDNNNLIGRKKKEENELSPFKLSMTPIFDDKKGIYKSDQGYCIDFEPSDYKDDFGNSYFNLSQLNNDSNENFEFNCVLLYYTLTNKSTNNKYINLYGVLFLEEITDLNTNIDSNSSTNSNSEDQGYIQRYPKIKGDGGGNGNSFGLKVDLKIDSLPDLTMTSVHYADINSAISMEMYMNALSEMQKCVSIFNRQQEKIIELQDKINVLESKFAPINEISKINDRISDLTGAINRSEPIIGLIDWEKIEEMEDIKKIIEKLRYSVDYGGVVIDGVNLKNLILENSKSIYSLVNGKLARKLQYNTDVLNEGYGINITPISEDSKVIINSSVPSYNITPIYRDPEMKYPIDAENKLSLNIDNPTSTTSTNIYISLLECSNLALLYIKDNSSSNCDFVINIDDNTYTSWKTGQSLKIKILGKLNAKDEKNNKILLPKIIINNGGYEITPKLNPLHVKNYTDADHIEIICINGEVSDSNPDKKFIYEIK